MLFGIEAVSNHFHENKQVLWSYASVSTGVDIYEFRVPYDANGNSVSWYVRSLNVRASTAASGATTFMLEKYTGTGAFSATNVLTSSLTLSGASTYEASTSGFSVSSLATGDKVRLNFSAAGSQAGVVVSLELGK